MTIIVFLIDTSASMNQRAYLGGRPKLLDIAKGAVETFVKVRQRSIDSKFDRYMLLTFEDPPQNIKAGWKESLNTFMTELKNLQCHGMTTMGTALKHVFDLLNINRIQSGIDTYGSGRCPYFLEPVVIVVITDGGRLTNNNGVQDEFNLPMHSPVLGSEMTREPFRWDQRLFSLVLRFSGTPACERDIGHVPSDNSPIDSMCEVTGGRSYSITSHRMLQQCIDSLVQKIQHGVVINFEKIGPDPSPLFTENNKDADNIDGDKNKEWESAEQKLSQNSNNRINNGSSINVATITNNSWHSCRKLIYVQRNLQKMQIPNGHWPIPESFWPDTSHTTLPARFAHPNIKFNCTNQEPLVIENLPFDKYELEPSPLTQYILARKQPTVCWQVFIPNSYKNSDVVHPFGYLKASTSLTCVNLFVMPYNYPVLLPLLDDFFKVHRLKVIPEWRSHFQNYLRTMPAYYCQPLRKALEKMGVPKATVQVLIPETMDNAYNYNIVNYLKKLKMQGKVEFDKLCNEINSKQVLGKTHGTNEGIRVTPRSALKKDLVSHPTLQKKFSSLRDQLNDFAGHVVAVPKTRKQCSRAGCQSYRNPFDIPRRNLLDQVFRMRSNFLQKNLTHTKLLDDDVAHSMPVSQMGNYQEYLKRIPSPLREVESTPVRQHTFGNPFKIDKRMIIDEADIDLVGGSSPQRSVSRRTPDLAVRAPLKRKPGPIPRHVQLKKRCLSPSPVVSPSNSPPPMSPVTPCLVNGDLDEITIPTLKIEEESRPRSPSPPPLDVLTPPPALEPFEHYNEDAPPPLSLISDLDETAIGTLTNHQNLPVNADSDVDSGVEDYNGLNSTDENFNNPIVNSKYKQVLSKKDIEEIKRYNLSIRASIYKEIRRFGKNYTKLFEYLNSLKGPLDMQMQVINDTIEESLRFKRKNLVNLLQDFAEKIVTRKENVRPIGLKNGHR
ncbi:hypothetical protein PGB90_002574 [Kerria lacca]